MMYYRLFKKKIYVIIILILISVGLIFFLTRENQNLNSPSWIKNIVWYQIIPDRWANGNSKNDASSRPIERGVISGNYNGMSIQDARITGGVNNRNKDWFVLTNLEKTILGLIQANLGASSGKITTSILNNRRFGGDFLGIEQHISYLQKLGISGILLQPVWISDSPIRYNIQDRRHIDPRLTNEFDNTKTTYSELVNSKYTQNRSFTEGDKEFFQLIQKLHQAGIKIIIDMPLLYGSVNNYMIEDIARNGEKSPYYNRFDFNTVNNKKDRQTCHLSNFYDPKIYPLADKFYYQGRWGAYCDKVYTRSGVGKFGIDNGLYEYYLRIFKRWLGTQIIDGISYEGADGIRLDAYIELSSKLVKQINIDIKKINPNAAVMTEERGPIISGIENKWFDMMSFYSVRGWSEALIIQSGRGLIEGVVSLTKRIDNFFKTKKIDTSVLMNYISSHDTDRILSKLIYTNKDLSVEAFRGVGIDYFWDRGHYLWDTDSITRADANAPYIHTKPTLDDINSFKAIVAFQFLLPGSPVIYYGDEIGMYGGDDPDNRQPMWWNLSDVFPRHTCKRGDNRNQYCLTNSETETYSGDPTLLLFYQKLSQLKHQSPALQGGDFSMKVCYGANKSGLACTDDATADPIIGFHRKKNDDHIIYVTSLEKELISYSEKIDTTEPSSTWINILDNSILSSDKYGLVDIGTTLKNKGFIVLKKIY